MSKILCKFIIAIFAFSGSVYAAKPIVSDSRIKTFVYSPNEVFHITTHYGYQSYIQFADKEEIEAISMGDKFPWKINKLDNRIFIAPKDGYAHTNMTVITDKHIYQFDLESKLPPEEADLNLTYAVRFYYPDNKFKPTELDEELVEATELPVTYEDDYNFQYSLTGSDMIAPTVVFDDKKKTYFKFPNENAVVPDISAVGHNSEITPLRYSRQGEFIVVDTLATNFFLKHGNNVVCVFNERNYVGSR